MKQTGSKTSGPSEVNFFFFELLANTAIRSGSVAFFCAESQSGFTVDVGVKLPFSYLCDGLE